MRITNTRVIISGILLASLCVGWGMAAEINEPPSLYTLRGGLPNVLAKLEAGKPVTVVYFGGSITAANGWSVLTHKWLGKRFPEAQVKMVNAGVGGTGSELGVFRMDEDVLAHKPDLVFVEFAVNDHMDAREKPDQVRRTIEGIVRKIWKQNLTTDICFFYTVHKDMVERYDVGAVPDSVAIMESIAKYYGIPSINGGLKAFQLGKQGKLNVPGLPWGKGVQRLANDDCHPNAHGHAIYTDLISETIESMIEPAAVAAVHSLPAPLRADCYEQAKMLAPSVAMKFSEGWTKTDAGRFRDRMSDFWTASKPGSTATIRFKGSNLFFFDVIGPSTGQFSVTVDGEDAGNRVRFDKWCGGNRMHWIHVAEGLDASREHTVTITILPEPPVAVRNPKKKSKGTTINIGGVMLMGELVKATLCP